MPDSETVLRSNRWAKKCKHNKFQVEPSLAHVECRICGEHLDPMWVLLHLCDDEQRAWARLKTLKELSEKAENKNRCKCEKCGEMTRIHRR